MNRKFVGAATAAIVAALVPLVSASPAYAFANPVDVQMVNETGHDMVLECTSPHKDYTVQSGGSVSFTGHAGVTSSDDDVSCKASVASDSMGEARFDVAIRNPHFGKPSVTVYTHKHKFAVGGSWTTSYNFVHVHVKRLADTNNEHKSFVITYTL